MRSLDIADAPLTAADEVERYSPSAIFLAPLLEVGRDTEGCVTGEKFNDRRLLLGQNLPENAEGPFIPDEDIKLTEAAVLLNVLHASSHACDIAGTVVRGVPEEVADATLDLDSRKGLTGVREVLRLRRCPVLSIWALNSSSPRPPAIHLDGTTMLRYLGSSLSAC